MLRLPAWCQRLSLTRVVRLAGPGPSGVGVCSTGWGLALPPHACPSVRGFFVAGRAARSSCEISSPTRHGASRSRTPARRAPPARSSCPRLLPRMVKSVLRRYHWRVDLWPPLFGAAWPGRSRFRPSLHWTPSIRRSRRSSPRRCGPTRH